MLAHHLCWPGTPKGLDMLASLYLDNYVYWKDESQEWSTDTDHISNWTYNCKDTRYTYDISLTLENVIRHFSLEEQYACQLAQWEMSRDMALRGVRIDGEAKKAVRAELATALKQYEEFLLDCMPEDLRYTSTGGPWFKSPKMSQEIIYHYLGVSPVLHKKSKRPTLDASSFEPIKKRAPWLGSLIEALDRMRSVGVFMSHFLDPPLSPDGCIRTSFNVGGTDTFRWSSSENPFGEGTNLQNIPKGDK
jgi:DNA polymerase I-like protein with 3'-5' exonuclease and polymerase domains